MSDQEQKQEIDFAGGKALSSKIPGFKYFPYRALVRIAKRFELGIERKGEKAWNALAKSRDEVAADKEFAIERAAHAAHHAMRLKAILAGEIEDDGDDHAAALGWSAMYLCEATEPRVVLKNCSACGGEGSVKYGDGRDSEATTKCPACKGTGKEKH
jgi:hypothetical protein